MSANFLRSLWLFVLIGLAHRAFGVDLEPPARGSLLSVVPLAAYTKEQLNADFAARDLEAQFDIKIYKVTFQTEAPNSTREPVQASGLIIVPVRAALVYPWISLQHGTILPKSLAPTLRPAEGRYEASQGFVTLVPDYLGYGDSGALLHPYLIEKGYVASGVDFLRAGQAFARQLELPLGPLFLQGYSEGGYATLSLQKALETQYAGEFPLKASAPNAGPFDMERLALNGLAAETNSPLSTAFIMLALAEWGGFDADLTKVINYDVPFLRTLLLADQPDPEAIKALPVATREFVKPAFIDDFIAQEPQTFEGKLARQAFAQQSLNRGVWTPTVPTRVHHCIDDEVVDVSHSIELVRHFKDQNEASPVSTLLLASPDRQRPYDHGSCPLIHAPAAWFKSLMETSTDTAY